MRLLEKVNFNIKRICLRSIDIDGLSAVICIVFFSMWQMLNNQMQLIRSISFFLPFCIVLLAAGRLVNRLPFWHIRRIDGFAFEILSGYCVFNTLLFITMTFSPLGLQINTFLIGGIILIVAWILKVFQRSGPSQKKRLDFYCISISLLGASLWSQDSIVPISRVYDGMVFKSWIDSFYHARIISEMANWSGGVPLGNLAIAGQTGNAYHYAGYMSSAVLASFTNIHSYAAFTGFHVPFGVFLTGLAAYVFMSAFWGKRAGLVATISLLLLPDAAQQGVHNSWLSYHWLQQIAPNGMYGIVMCVMAWLFMFKGCARKDFRSIVLSYLFLPIILIYKAQIFVPNAIVLWLWPSLFLKNVKLYQRMSWFVSAFLILYCTIHFSGNDVRVPTLIFDGSGFRVYSQWVMDQFDEGGAKSFILWLQSFCSLRGVGIWDGIIRGFAIFIGTVGVWGIIGPWVGLTCRKKIPNPNLWFPVAVIGMYLLMACLLALDVKGIGTPEELLHRPFIWAYFVGCIWTSSTLYHIIMQKRKIFLNHRPYHIYLICLILAIIPLKLGQGLEKGPAFGADLTNRLVPFGLVQACEFIRENASDHDTIQDSQYDPSFITTALSERQSYFLRSMYGTTHLPLFQERLEAVQELQGIDSLDKLKEFENREKIDWYILHPLDRVNWPSAIVQHPSFECNEYRVYHLSSLLK